MKIRVVDRGAGFDDQRNEMSHVFEEFMDSTPYRKLLRITKIMYSLFTTHKMHVFRLMVKVVRGFFFKTPL